MKNVINNLLESFRRAMGLESIEDQLEELNNKLAEQESRITAILAVIVNQQQLVAEKIRSLEDAIDQLTNRCE